MLGIKIYYNEFGRAFYSVKSDFPKETIDAEIRLWDDELCLNVLTDYSLYYLRLEWMSHSDMRELIRKALKRYAEITGVSIITPHDKAHRDTAEMIGNWLTSGDKK